MKNILGSRQWRPHGTWGWERVDLMRAGSRKSMIAVLSGLDRRNPRAFDRNYTQIGRGRNWLGRH
jgi:hypothetical protein